MKCEHCNATLRHIEIAVREQGKKHGVINALNVTILNSKQILYRTWFRNCKNTPMPKNYKLPPHTRVVCKP